MRHGKKINHLGRKTAHRKSMLANMSCSLIEHKRINTTVAKAKALRVFVEPLVTKSKVDTTHNRRLCFAKLRDKYAVAELFRAVAPKVGDRPGGYTRIIKLGNRLGDNADMAMIELVDFNEIYSVGKPEKKKTTRRAGRGKKSTDTATVDSTEANENEAEKDTSAKNEAKEADKKATAEPKAKGEDNKTAEKPTEQKTTDKKADDKKSDEDKKEK